MDSDSIEAIGIDSNGSLWIRPSKASFPMIYREANGVQWDDARRCLHAPRPREWTYVEWLRHILSTVRASAVELRLTPETEWIGIDADLRRTLEGI